VIGGSQLKQIWIQSEAIQDEMPKLLKICKQRLAKNCMPKVSSLKNSQFIHERISDML